MKAWVSKGIRYPPSPRPQRWVLLFGLIARKKTNVLNTPPGNYDRKIKTQRNWRGPAQVVEHVV
jgi:hypothetical protein